ncbi:MAG: hydrogenase maturation nickel metallochaperone HypA [Bacteroidales bacterium]
MHEFSIAQSIIDIAEDSAKKENCRKITSIKLEVGTLSGIVLEALETAMEFAVKKTMLEGAQVEIVKIDAKAECKNCGHNFSITGHFQPCPRCKSFKHLLLKGDKIKVMSLEAE